VVSDFRLTGGGGSMSTVRSEEPSIKQIVAAMGVVFAGVVLLSTFAQVGEILRVLFGWMLPILCFGMLLGTTIDTLVHFTGKRKRREGSRIENVLAAITVNLGALVLLLAVCWGWVSGLVLWGDGPTLEENVLTVCFLVGGSGLLLSQRWAGVLVCGTGWWWLSQLLWLRLTSPVVPDMTVALSLAALVLPFTVTVAASWRYRQNRY
jgi:hypothetical protein